MGDGVPRVCQWRRTPVRNVDCGLRYIYIFSFFYIYTDVEKRNTQRNAAG